MIDQDEFPILRQVVLGAANVESVAEQLSGSFGLAPGFADPILETMGLADETIRVGPQAHLEVVAPLRDDVALASWLRKGGGGGYALSIQVPSVQPYVDRAAAEGVRVAADLNVYGRRIVQLHPGDMGLLIELDEIEDPSVWFWDDVPRVEPVAPIIDDVRAVGVSTPDPTAQALRWAAVFGTGIDESSGVPTLRLGSRSVRFSSGPRRMLSAVEVSAVSGAAVPSEPVLIGGVRFTVVAG
ncbi:hypothetical protein [Nocardia sp. NBC_00416]|uniref:hypothetical protein n=1 Tax=Nocardia sp. NBC_00416 TaxID=2975991 RepID=UPI002E1D7CEB